MADVIASVSAALRAAGYRTGEANPGAVLPEITEPVVAVNLERVDAADMAMVVRATVVSPLKLGAKTCETHGLAVCRALSNMGRNCQLQPCQFNPKTEMFTSSVLVTLQGNVLDEDWITKNIFQVRIGAYYLDKVLSVTAQQEGGGTLQLNDCAWKIRIEERLSEIREENIPVNAANITVQYERGQEVYTNCRLIGRQRIFRDGALIQIWNATAQSRTLGE